MLIITSSSWKSRFVESVIDMTALCTDLTAFPLGKGPKQRCLMRAASYPPTPQNPGHIRFSQDSLAEPRCKTLIGPVRWDRRSIQTAQPFVKRLGASGIVILHCLLSARAGFLCSHDHRAIESFERRCRCLGTCWVCCASYLTSPHVCGSVGFARSQDSSFLGTSSL